MSDFNQISQSFQPLFPVSTKSNTVLGPFSHLGKSKAKHFKPVSLLNAPRQVTLLLAACKLCNIDLLGRWWLYIIVLACVWRQLGQFWFIIGNVVID